MWPIACFWMGGRLHPMVGMPVVVASSMLHVCGFGVEANAVVSY